MEELRVAERALSDLSMALHWRAGRVDDTTVAHHLREIADRLADEAETLRDLWASGFAPLE
jgi:UTP:GlnB (protein PII) uridylyltransferase